jgi:hypothetical protein
LFRLEGIPSISRPAVPHRRLLLVGLVVGLVVLENDHRHGPAFGEDHGDDGF